VSCRAHRFDDQQRCGADRDVCDGCNDETACQLPVELCSQLATGTRNEAVPLAVYRRPAFVAAYFDPYVSVQSREQTVDLAHVKYTIPARHDEHPRCVPIVPSAQ